MPTAEERALWRAAVRGAKPLGRSAGAKARSAKSTVAPEPLRGTVPGSAARPLAVANAAEPAAASRRLTIDRRRAEQLKRGQIRLEARLDLHGLFQDEAHAALAHFLTSCAAAGKRCVLVITGKGSERLGSAPPRPGVLQTAVPRWLAEPALRDTIMGFGPAGRYHGGAGALYVLLRRRRPPA